MPIVIPIRVKAPLSSVVSFTHKLNTINAVQLLYIYIYIDCTLYIYKQCCKIWKPFFVAFLFALKHTRLVYFCRK